MRRSSIRFLEVSVFFRQLVNDETACASYLLGCKTYPQLAVFEPHVDLVGAYIAMAEAQAAPIVAVFDSHVQADHVSGMAELVARTGATAYLPEGTGVEFEHRALADGEVVRLGNTEVQAIATPGHALAHHAYLVTGHALLVGDAGRPDLHAHGEHTAEEMARMSYRSITERLLTLPDYVLLYPSHYSGAVCGRGLSANPLSPIGFERLHNDALGCAGEDEFVAALMRNLPPAPEDQAQIVTANRLGGVVGTR